MMLDYFPNADHAGIYAAQAAGLYEQAGLDVKLQPPPDPSAPLKLLRGRPRRRRDLLRARAAARARPGRREPRRRRRARADAADVADRAARRPACGRAADLAGKRVGTSGIPYQSAYLKTILEQGRRRPGSVKETNVGFNLDARDAVQEGRRDARLVLELRGRRPPAPQPQAGDPADGEARRADLQRADLRRPARGARRRRRVAAAALPVRHGRRPPAAARRTPRPASTRC